MNKKLTKENALLVTAKELAEMLSVSPRHIWRMRSSGKLPRPIEIGNCVRWKLLDISDWLAMGCPSMGDYEAKKAV